MSRQRRTGFEAKMAMREELNRSEAAGEVADSMQVRLALIARMDKGELTLKQVQAELKKIQRGAKAAGQVTRAQAFRRG